MKADVLTIGGLDPNGNAGILRDNEILYSMNRTCASMITSLTVQGDRKFVSSTVTDTKILSKQWDIVLQQNQPKAIKVGMLGNHKVVHLFTKLFGKTNIPVVLDPIIFSSSGGRLLSSKGSDYLFPRLVSKVDLWTPNIEEAEYFYGSSITSRNDVMSAAAYFRKRAPSSVLIKGFRENMRVYDYYSGKNSSFWMYGQYIDNLSVRGTGCAYASYIAGCLSFLLPLEASVKMAKKRMNAWIKRQI